MFEHFSLYSTAHVANIAFHVGFGSIGIAIGTRQLFGMKGGAGHRRRGRFFVAAYAIVIACATLGVLFFQSNLFLSLLTLSAGYTCFAGVRAAKLGGNPPRSIDNMTAITCLALCVIIATELAQSENTFSSQVIYTTLINLALYCAYDLMRNVFSDGYLKASWLPEHIFKILGALGALMSAATGNLFQGFGAVSQLAPTVVLFFISVAFIISVIYQQRSGSKGQRTTQAGERAAAQDF